MPMFDYKCNSCGHKFDKLVPFSESEKIVECPKCKKHDSNKLLCAPNISNGGSDSRPNGRCNSSSVFTEQTKSVVIEIIY